jgi:hypothetical protein
MEKFNAGCAPGKTEAASGVKTPWRKLKLLVAPESGHNST